MTSEYLTVVVPCFNEEETLAQSVTRLIEAFSDAPEISLDVLIVDDCSSDNSLKIAQSLVDSHPEVRLLAHEVNQGKGGALQTGFAAARGNYVAIHDADLEYDPKDLLRLIKPLQDGTADVVYGSRFQTSGPRRILYFWHSMGNAFLTLLSNMFTDMNLTDMETCYKVFKREVLQSLKLTEKRFGIEPEMTARIADLRLRVYEIGISYFGRTYAEGKKIGARDGFRALYCIVKFNAHRLPMPVQFLAYLFIGGLAGIFNLFLFAALQAFNLELTPAVLISFIAAAIVNYLLCIALLFRHNARWTTPMELATYSLVVAGVAALDLFVTTSLVAVGTAPLGAKAAATIVDLAFNFVGRRFFVFPEAPRGTWKRQSGEP